MNCLLVCLSPFEQDCARATILIPMKLGKEEIIEFHEFNVSFSNVARYGILACWRFALNNAITS